MIINQIIKGLFGATYAIVGKNPESGEWGYTWLEFETIDECSMTGNSIVTKYPTETGIDKTDYKYSTPDTVSIVGIISRGGVLKVNSLKPLMGTLNKETAIERIRKNLKTLKRNMILVSIKTRNGGLWKNMTLSDYTIDETADNFGLFQVSMQFQEVPQFNEDGELVENVSDTNTKNNGQTMTQPY